jgi:hypothetical protein
MRQSSLLTSSRRSPSSSPLRTRASGAAVFSPYPEPERELHSRLRDLKNSTFEEPTIVPEMGDRRTVADFAKATTQGARSSIARPAVDADAWQIPPQITNMITH